jgi:DNA-directed RNA polymerase subunit RPC12/RpoP
MLGDVRGLLVYGIAAAKAGDKAEAQRYFERVLFDSASTYDEKAKAHIWLTQLTDDLAEKRDHLEHALAFDPTNSGARRGLAILDGRLQEMDIIDPDQQPAQIQPETPQPITARRFVCPQCGGTMGFEPGDKMLRCEYCGHRQTVLSALNNALVVEEHDFAVALAVKQGHVIVSGVRTLQCQGCQARMLLSGEISAKCPYCGSPHVAHIDAGEIIQPEGIVPFAVSEEQAQQTFQHWLDKNVGNAPTARVRTTHVRGVYLPAWTFDISGEIRWRGTEPNNSRSSGGGFGSLIGDMGTQSTTGGYGGSQKTVHEGSHYALEDDILIPATHKLPQDLSDIFHKFLLKEAVPYDPAYLANWPAEIYTITVSDASLSARQTVLKKGEKIARIQATARVSNIQNFQAYPTNLSVLSYKLLLLPFWLANYRYEDTVYAVVVNGQTNRIAGQKPPGLLKKLFGNIF